MYDVDKDLEYLNTQLALYICIIGLDIDRAETYSIDDLIEQARIITDIPIVEIDSGKLEGLQEPMFLFLKNQRIALIANIRRLWYMRSIALGAKNEL